MKLFLVGGAVRDSIMGIKPHDLDFTVVLPDTGYVDPFRYMVDTLKADGFTIFVEAPEFFTARGRFPKRHSMYPNMAGDFVLARKEGEYTDGRRPDKVEVGTLADDIFRRDLTINALAQDINGDIIDLVGGQLDIQRKLIRAVGDPLERLSEDPLRALRALRFMVTKGFKLDIKLANALREPSIHAGIVESVSDERIAEELGKMFRFDTVNSMLALNMFPAVMAAAFSGNVSLDSTLKMKGRGK